VFGLSVAPKVTVWINNQLVNEQQDFRIMHRRHGGGANRARFMVERSAGSRRVLALAKYRIKELPN
jgi:hypothetical protein